MALGSAMDEEWDVSTLYTRLRAVNDVQRFVHALPCVPFEYPPASLRIVLHAFYG